MDCIVVDLETTGLKPTWHKITEIGAVRLRDGLVVDEFHTMVNPMTKIPEHITHITGITDAMVADAPKPGEALRKFLSFAGDDILVAHNASFDCGFLTHHCLKHAEMEMNNRVLCTRLLANKVLPDLHSKKLGVLCKVFNVTNDEAHRALSDARATAQVLMGLSGLLTAMDKQIEDFVR